MTCPAVQFAFLSKSTTFSHQLTENLPAAAAAMEALQSELNKYIAELKELSHRQENDVKPLCFQKMKENLSLPQTNSWGHSGSTRISGVCGLLSSGIRNRMFKSLEMRVCLKPNRNARKASGFMTFEWLTPVGNCTVRTSVPASHCLWWTDELAKESLFRIY